MVRPLQNAYFERKISELLDKKQKEFCYESKSKLIRDILKNYLNLCCEDKCLNKIAGSMFCEIHNRKNSFKKQEQTQK